MFWIKSFLLGAAVVVGVGPLAIHRCASPVRFNQLMVVQANLFHGKLRTREIADAFRTCWESGARIACGGGEQTTPTIEDEKAVFDYIFSWLPRTCVVYPTEGFYYFITELNGTPVMGNMRVADLHNGVLSSAYYTVPDKHTWTYRAGAGEGLTVQKHSDYDFTVAYNGREVRFVTSDVDFSPPKRLRLTPDERFVGQVFDESAVQFFLLFNEATSSFYYLLNDEEGLNETLDDLGDSVWVGRRTGFAFYRDEEYGRMVMIGAGLEHADRNDYFDGPQDQVPFRARHREYLHRAYPNTLLGDGIDEHGVYLNTPEWIRIAITPFIRYARLAELTERVRSCAGETDRSKFWTALTKEWWNDDGWLRDIDRRLAKEGKSAIAAR